MLWRTQHPANPHRFCATVLSRTQAFWFSTADSVTDRPTISNSPPRFEQTCRTSIPQLTFPTRSRIFMAASTSEILHGNLCLAATRYLRYLSRVVSGPRHISESDILALFSQIVHQSHAWSGMVIQYEVRSKPDQSVRYRWIDLCDEFCYL